MRLRNIPRAESVLGASPYVIKNPSSCRGKWAENVFQSSSPIHIEIGMGKGQFLLTLAKQNPSVNYIGIERYSSVLLRAVEKLGESGTDSGDTACRNPADRFQNLRFVCCDAAGLPDFFAPGEISRIYLNFSDPWPKARHARRRLTSREYFSRYDLILARGGQVEFKTDNRALFDFSTGQLDSSDTWEIAGLTYDLHRDGSMCAGNVMTEYEARFSSAGTPICKLIAKRRAEGDLCI
ncbi:MAG: tRNA (guanosine(46)-N7)-methyltransferase TrmB [Dorea sp.]|jgi:tRNA (guanine-N7-)-methyltransferase|nr:tRNA (guanosine(46)-N7)-methyltransferase TrmB [Dorea sp.]